LCKYFMAAASSQRRWDSHSDIRKIHARLSAEVDKPIAGLLKDLKRRGLLNDTLVVWGTEFGRTPAVQGPPGMAGSPPVRL